MTLADEYRRQFKWRPWPRILGALPDVRGRTILDVGCGIGDQAAEFVARGARVVGIDADPDLLDVARSRGLPNAEFLKRDARDLDLGIEVDGIWSSFTAAYIRDLPAALTTWARHLQPGGWIALTEIDDLFGHEPLGSRTAELLVAFAEDALRAGRYDFRMGRKLQPYLEQCGFEVSPVLISPDAELSFTGAGGAEVVEAWRLRLARMKHLQQFCGAEFQAVGADLLSSLASPEHRSTARVYSCIATRSVSA